MISTNLENIDNIIQYRGKKRKKNNNLSLGFIKDLLASKIVSVYQISKFIIIQVHIIKISTKSSSYRLRPPKMYNPLILKSLKIFDYHNVMWIVNLNVGIV